MLLPSSTGYSTALSYLKSRFGQNDQIARSYIDELTTGQCIKANDVNGLVSFADDLRICDTVLSQLDFSSDLDASGTLRSLAKRLPYNLRQKWVEKASTILKNGKQPKFKELAQFVNDRAVIASNQFGLDLANDSKEKNDENIRSQTKPKENNKDSSVSTLATDTESTHCEDTLNKPKVFCEHCDIPGHSIWKCHHYKKLDLNEKIELVKKHHLCYRCLKRGHVSRDCDRSCPKCNGNHHFLLHKHQSQSQKDDVHSAATEDEENKSNKRSEE